MSDDIAFIDPYLLPPPRVSFNDVKGKRRTVDIIAPGTTTTEQISYTIRNSLMGYGEIEDQFLVQIYYQRKGETDAIPMTWSTTLSNARNDNAETFYYGIFAPYEG